MSIFTSPTWQQAHAGIGWLLALLAVLMPILVFPARLPRGIVILTLLVFVLTFVQVSLVTWVHAFRIPELNSLHPLNALLLFYVALATAHRATRFVLGQSRSSTAESLPTIT
jgi:hypothetical protein